DDHGHRERRRRRPERGHARRHGRPRQSEEVRLLARCGSPCYRDAVLVSHRRHETPFGGACLSVDRIVSASFMLKRVEIRGLVQDERLTKGACGSDTDRPRRRLAIVLDGSVCDSTGREDLVLAPGDASLVSEGTRVESRWWGDVLEMEWDPASLDDGDATPPARIRLGAVARTRASALADALRERSSAAAVVPALKDLLVALRAEGVPFAPERVKLDATACADQEL